jgi:adenylate cyclase
MSATRRLAAILAADVVGYSRLMGEDEAGTARAVREHREAATPIVRSHGGRIVKTMGDGVLLEFPSVVAAVECAIAIQKLMAERNADVPEGRHILYRIGVHIGDVLIDGKDILGDGVNIAARLEGIAQAGGICVSGSAFEHVQGRVEAAFTDLGDKSLKNIARPVRVYQISLGAIRSTETLSEIQRPAFALPDKPSIAVLPFHNMSGDPEQDYFADGMVEDIITSLSRIKWLFVVARNSSSVYKGRAVDVRQIGRDLGVRYVMEGGVRKVDNRVRITAQLLEAETGAHLWADKYDGALEDIFDLQDRITDRVAGIVEPSLQRSEIERSRRKRPENLDAYDLYLRALPFTSSQTPEDAKIAIPLLEKALKLDPQYAAAHALLAWCHEWCFTRGGLNEANREAGLRHARAALFSATDDATALAVAGFALILMGKDQTGALEAIERALSFNPSCATALYLGAVTASFMGLSSKASAFAERALRLSPFDLHAFEGHHALGNAALQEERYDDAASHLSRAVQANPNHSGFRFARAVALALAGRLEEARPVAQSIFELEPGFRMRSIFELGLAPSLKEKYARGGRLLGLPE